jgi:hypothetical protein
VPIINRHLSKASFERAKHDLRFLVSYVRNSHGELAIEFRGPSELSVYDRGFRLAQVRFGRDGDYRVRTHKKFIKSTPLEDSEEFPTVPDSAKDYATFAVPAKSIHRLLQANHVARMRTRIKDIRHKEEVGIAHFIAADTMQGREVVVIDREVGDSDVDHRGERLDLLALQRRDDGQYRFLAIEVKLGNNPELDTVTQTRRGERSAVGQVEGYRDQIEKCFEAYRDCYRTSVAQKIGLGLLDNWAEPPEIVRDTKALLVVAGYTGMAQRHLDVIARDHPGLWVKTIRYGLRSEAGKIIAT